MAAPVPSELVARAASFDHDTRVGAIASLEALATPAAWQLVLVLLQRDYDPRVRAFAAAALGTSRDPTFLEALRYSASADADPYVRVAAAASAAALAPFGRRPKLAAGLSVICPGCGYFYLGKPERALAFLGTFAWLIAPIVIDASPLVLGRDAIVHSEGRDTLLLMAAQNVWFYGVYATYRDARLARDDYGARYPVAREDLGDLLFAPFNPRVLKSPWVWAGLPLMLGAAVGASYGISRFSSSGSTTGTMRHLFDGHDVQFLGNRYDTATGFALGDAYNVSLYLPVGVGEEALFRGVVQAGLSETSLGLWGGWAVGSAIFGAAHTFNFIGDANGVREAALAVPYLMATGSYLGFLYIHGNFSLLQGAAVHFWYDFLLGTIDFVVDPDHQPFVARFGMPF